MYDCGPDHTPPAPAKAGDEVLCLDCDLFDTLPWRILADCFTVQIPSFISFEGKALIHIFLSCPDTLFKYW